MEVTFLPLLLALVVGLTHAFEADHLIAVSNIVTRRKNFSSAVKDGVFWGLGHTTTILIIGAVLIIGRMTVMPESSFDNLELLVGAMLIGLGVYRLTKKEQASEKHEHDKKNLAYGIGLIHGIAGSGALIFALMAEQQSVLFSMSYLVLFGLGSIVGMLIAAGIFGLPFYRNNKSFEKIQQGILWLSSLACILYGAWIFIRWAAF